MTPQQRLESLYSRPRFPQSLRNGLGGIRAWGPAWASNGSWIGSGFRGSDFHLASRARLIFPAKAKRVIHIFANGGPSQVDTFDPKPMLRKWHGKLLPNTLKTERVTGAAMGSPFEFKRYGQSGIEVSELFSHVGECIDDIAVIRSLHTDVPNHEPSLLMMNCGESRLPRPSMGSWLTYGLGTENQNLPGFIAMCPNGFQFPIP